MLISWISIKQARQESYWKLDSGFGGVQRAAISIPTSNVNLAQDSKIAQNLSPPKYIF